MKMELEDAPSSYAAIFERCILRTLGLAVAKALPRLEDQDGNTIWAVVVRLIGSVSEESAWIHNQSLKHMWACLLWEFLGDIITGATLKAVLVEKIGDIQFECSHVSRYPNLEYFLDK